MKTMADDKQTYQSLLENTYKVSKEKVFHYLHFHLKKALNP